MTSRPNIKMGEVSVSAIERMIYIIRGQKVMLDHDLAGLYEITTKSLNRSVSRNIGRFPEDFMFQLTPEEHETLRYQIGTARPDWARYARRAPFAFTEQGVAMLSSVLSSPRAIAVNISIMRFFVKIRRILLQENLFERVERLEKSSDKLFKVVFERLDTLEAETPILPENRRKIGP